jgi:predicted amidophosphoribosyltransferase
MEAKFCTCCGRHRLSVADVEGVCMFCTHPDRPPRRVAIEKVCAVCGGAPVTHRGRCGECNREDARNQRLRAKGEQ